MDCEEATPAVAARPSASLLPAICPWSPKASSSEKDMETMPKQLAAMDRFLAEFDRASSC